MIEFNKIIDLFIAIAMAEAVLFFILLAVYFIVSKIKGQPWE